MEGIPVLVLLGRDLVEPNSASVKIQPFGIWRARFRGRDAQPPTPLSLKPTFEPNVQLAEEALQQQAVGPHLVRLEMRRLAPVVEECGT